MNGGGDEKKRRVAVNGGGDETSKDGIDILGVTHVKQQSVLEAGVRVVSFDCSEGESYTYSPSLPMPQGSLKRIDDAERLGSSLDKS